MASKLTWNAKEIEKTTGQTVEKNMTKALLFAEAQAKTLVSRGNLAGDNPSLPGEPPKVVSGTLRANIGSEVRIGGTDVIGALGVKKSPADDYARRLELGFTGTDSLGRTYSQLPRPFLVPSIFDNKDRILAIIRGG